MKPRFAASARVKILAWILVPVLVLLASLLSAVAFLVLSDKQAQIDTHLQREATELQLLAERAIDPATNARFESARSLLELYISRTVPDPNETMFVMAEGLVFARSGDTPFARLDLDEEFLEIVARTDSAVLGDYQNSLGQIRYLVVPVSGKEDSGALVAVVFSDLEFHPIRELLGRLALISVLLLVGVGAVGWAVAGRVLAPVRSMTKTASLINSEDLSARITQSGTREFDELAGQFNQMLERIQLAMQSQRRFVDDAGHELRTPLTIIRGHLDLMEADPSQADYAMPIIRDELERLGTLVADLQTLTSSQSTEFVNLEDSDLTELAKEIAAKAKSLTELRVEVLGAEGIWFLDRHRITQAILQLVENASKHTPETGQIQISFRVGSELEIEVSDSGSGIAPQNYDSVFEPFFRAKGEQHIEGSGLGLSIVREIVRAHGGAVSAGKSALGGAAITLRIPRS